MIKKPKTADELEDWLKAEPNHDDIQTLRAYAKDLVVQGLGNKYQTAWTWRAILKAEQVLDSPDYANWEDVWSGQIHNGDEESSNEIRKWPFNLIASFQTHVDNGEYPAPELICALNDIFAHFYESKGKKTLDEAFFGERKPHQRSEAYWGDDLYYFSLAFEIDFNPDYSIEKTGSLRETIKKFLEEGDYKAELASRDMDSFERGFRRFREKQNKKLQN